MGAVIGLVGGHEVAGGHLSVDLGAEVGERGTQPLVLDRPNRSDDNEGVDQTNCYGNVTTGGGQGATAVRFSSR